MDAALISSAQRVEHHEIADYGTVGAYADLLGEAHASLLRETLDEEKETDEKLTELAKEINVKAEAGAAEPESSEEQPKGKRKPRRAA